MSRPGPLFFQSTPKRRSAGRLRAIMAMLTLAWTLQAVAQGEASAPADTQQSKGTLLHPKVDKPIPDTYEPLNGTRSEDRDVGTDPIRESWDMKKKQKERKREEKDNAGEAKGNAPDTLQKDIKIQEPDIKPVQSPQPHVDKGKDSMQIHDQ